MKKIFFLALFCLAALITANSARAEVSFSGKVSENHSNVTYWGEIDNGSIDLVVFYASKHEPSTAAKLWNGQNVQVCVYNFKPGTLLENHPGFLKALAHARAIRNGLRSGKLMSCGEENCFYQRFKSNRWER